MNPLAIGQLLGAVGGGNPAMGAVLRGGVMGYAAYLIWRQSGDDKGRTVAKVVAGVLGVMALGELLGALAGMALAMGPPAVSGGLKTPPMEQ